MNEILSAEQVAEWARVRPHGQQIAASHEALRARVAVLTEERDEAEESASQHARWGADHAVRAKELEQRVAVLEAGLQFYADPTNWEARTIYTAPDPGPNAGASLMESGPALDGGAHARATLGGVPAAAPGESFALKPQPYCARCGKGDFHDIAICGTSGPVVPAAAPEPTPAPHEERRRLRKGLVAGRGSVPLVAPQKPSVPAAAPERCRECGGVVDSPGTVRYVRCTNEFHQRCPTCGSTDRAERCGTWGSMHDEMAGPVFYASEPPDAWHGGETPS